MEKHLSLNESLDQVISNENSTHSMTTTSEDDSNFRPLLSHRERLRNFVHSHTFQVAIIVLVILDCLLVIGELMLDLKILELHENDDASKVAPHVLHYMSIAILSIFIIEIAAKIYAFGLEFFRHKLEIFDVIVVIISFGLDIAFREEEAITNGFGLVIILRLWRVARILNGVVLSVKTQADHKLLKERRCREGVEQELQKCRDYATALEMEVETLRNLLKQHEIKEVPPTVIESTTSKHTINVEVEVNHEEPT